MGQSPSDLVADRASELEVALDAALRSVLINRTQALHGAQTVAEECRHAAGHDPRIAATGACARAFLAQLEYDDDACEALARTALEAAPEHATRTRQIAVQLLGRSLMRQGRVEEAEARYADELDRATSRDDPQGEGIFLTMLAGAMLVRGEHAQAIAHLRDALPRLRAAGSRSNEEKALFTLAMAYESAGSPVAAIEALHGSATLCRSLAHVAELGTRLSMLARLLAEVGRPDLAHEPAQESAEICRQIGNAKLLLPSLWALAHLHLELGDVPMARRIAEEQWRAAHDMQSVVLRAGAHRTMAVVLLAAGVHDEAAEHARAGIASADASDTVGVALSCKMVLARIANSEKRHEHAVGILTSALASATDREARLRADALELLAEIQRAAGDHHRAAATRQELRELEQAILRTERDVRLAHLDFARPESDPKDLTPRQREILEQLARGRTMQEAGEALGISARTVKFHKQRIMERCGLGSDAELVLLAVRLGLASAAGGAGQV